MTGADFQKNGVQADQQGAGSGPSLPPVPLERFLAASGFTVGKQNTPNGPVDSLLVSSWWQVPQVIFRLQEPNQKIMVRFSPKASPDEMKEIRKFLQELNTKGGNEAVVQLRQKLECSKRPEELGTSGFAGDVDSWLSLNGLISRPQVKYSVTDVLSLKTPVEPQSQALREQVAEKLQDAVASGRKLVVALEHRQDGKPAAEMLSEVTKEPAQAPHWNTLSAEVHVWIPAKDQSSPTSSGSSQNAAGDNKLEEKSLGEFLREFSDNTPGETPPALPDPGSQQEEAQESALAESNISLKSHPDGHPLQDDSANQSTADTKIEPPAPSAPENLSPVLSSGGSEQVNNPSGGAPGADQGGADVEERLPPGDNSVSPDGGEASQEISNGPDEAQPYYDSSDFELSGSEENSSSAVDDLVGLSAEALEESIFGDSAVAEDQAEQSMVTNEMPPEDATEGVAAAEAQGAAARMSEEISLESQQVTDHLPEDSEVSGSEDGFVMSLPEAGYDDANSSSGAPQGPAGDGHALPTAEKSGDEAATPEQAKAGPARASEKAQQICNLLNEHGCDAGTRASIEQKLRDELAVYGKKLEEKSKKFDELAEEVRRVSNDIQLMEATGDPEERIQLKRQQLVRTSKELSERERIEGERQARTKVLEALLAARECSAPPAPKFLARFGKAVKSVFRSKSALDRLLEHLQVLSASKKKQGEESPNR